jgi:hypothetical protein
MSVQLPTDRVFLIRLSSIAEPSAGIYRGRIEHIRSGRITRFSSIEKVEQFISEVLAEEMEAVGTERQPDQSVGNITKEQ